MNEVRCRVMDYGSNLRFGSGTSRWCLRCPCLPAVRSLPGITAEEYLRILKLEFHFGIEFQMLLFMH